MVTTIVIDEGYPDTAATHLAAALSGRGGAEIVTLSEFLTEAGVKFCDSGGNIVWDTTAFHDRFPETDAHRICNRVVSISRKTLAALGDHEMVLAPNLVFGSYASVLREFAQVWGTPGLYSPVGNLLPLNLQWRLFGSKITDIGTPKFVYGFGFVKVDTHDFRQPLWKSPFDLYTWKPEEADQNRIHPFVVDKPEGNPVLLYFVGNAAEVFTLGAQRDAGERTKSKLMEYSVTIKQMFGAFMGEALFFEDDGRLTFGAFSHYLKTSIGDANFSAVVQEGLAQSDA